MHLRAARLQHGLHAIDRSTFIPDLITEAGYGFHEGASIRKRNGIYYLVYTDISRGRATCLSYATAPTPLGPFVKRGIIIDNTGCDPETWNNHGSIAEFNGQWYVFYHRSSQASNFNRRVCIEPITFSADDSIAEVDMTTQGASGPIPAVEQMEAWRACLLSGKVRTESVGPTLSDSTITEYLTWIHDGDWAAYKYLDFGAGVTAFQTTAGSLAYGGRIEIRLDAPDGRRIGVCTIPRTGGWQKWQTVECPVEEVSGVHALYLVFRGMQGRLFDLSGFAFQ
jgi:arabinoxylan arabinofuranohydrolase